MTLADAKQHIDGNCPETGIEAQNLNPKVITPLLLHIRG